ncbi:S-adenosyl-L-methionine-dependent methyltransferase [Trichoderma longibrachiatum]
MDAEDGTVPLDETYAETVNYHGRIFQRHALDSKIYYAPIDDEEIARLGNMHTMLRTVFDNRLIFPPVVRPRRILECGFGAAHWAVDVAEQYPDAKVVGLDISPHMIPEEMPNNLDLQVDDLNGDMSSWPRFTFPSNHFDVVHSQMMAGGIHATRWPSYLQDMYRVLQPGGWCQLVEIYFNAQSDNGTLSPDHALSRWSSGYLDAMHPQKDPRAALRLKDWMRNAGFTDIESRLLTLPMCSWPTGMSKIQRLSCYQTACNLPSDKAEFRSARPCDRGPKCHQRQSTALFDGLVSLHAYSRDASGRLSAHGSSSKKRGDKPVV